MEEKKKHSPFWTAILISYYEQRKDKIQVEFESFHLDQSLCFMLPVLLN